MNGAVRESKSSENWRCGKCGSTEFLLLDGCHIGRKPGVKYKVRDGWRRRVKRSLIKFVKYALWAAVAMAGSAIFVIAAIKLANVIHVLGYEITTAVCLALLSLVSCIIPVSIVLGLAHFYEYWKENPYDCTRLTKGGAQ